ncbi:DUF412 family protein [Psychrosphaera sp. B3R10]|uniref:UPF0208 membrane protein YfbV n=1 Tax=Psychrosphaera algicola TaxID=3023714 RepID=A0ABT5F8E7_9GAMM|nr:MULTISPECIES: DUF412 family protein [unclassified Psychrosphaera]MBU2882220.1 DUF412 family protein [Psychrosphaera sp. I2R16]MBU2988901.1 DUF412 family protein [Psychrosphaera sp. B3R10]MDC2887819.1 DUF412 family protein [Psychrosphaera sp. G1-22]MDO6717921.1 DUF412 family protein [Psychrosphaera sp. 1_MG-2023]
MLIIKTLKTGYDFSQLWPKREPYLAMFDQTRAVKLALLSLTLMPSLAIVTAFLHLQFFGTSQINLTFAMTILFLSIPVQAFYVLGLKANSQLPVSLRVWYRELESKIKLTPLVEPGLEGKADKRLGKSDNKLTFLDLACVLHDLFDPSKRTNKSFN